MGNISSLMEPPRKSPSVNGTGSSSWDISELHPHITIRNEMISDFFKQFIYLLTAEHFKPLKKDPAVSVRA